MKKVVILLLAVTLYSIPARSQFNLSTPTISLVDTLHYYFNKQYFRAGQPISAFPYYKAASVNAITLIGNRFENSGPLQIVGLEGFATIEDNSGQQSIVVRLYLLDVDNTGEPVWPPLDSVSCVLTQTMLTGACGGPLLHGPRIVTGDFAVMIKNCSTTSGDTARVYRTSAMSATSGAPAQDKFSDGYGVFRNAGFFKSATSYTTAGFPAGSDYEFLLAPIVKYDIWAAHQPPSKILNGETICTFENVTFQNKSARQWTHRMYNMNEFYRKWQMGVSNDSAIAWFIEPNQGGALERIFLPYCNSFTGCNNFVSTYTSKALKDVSGEDSLTCFPDCAFRARFRGMSAYGKGVVLESRKNVPGNNTDTLLFTMCTSFCGNDNVGLIKHDLLSVIKIFPNPANTGIVYIGGSPARAEIQLIGLRGEIIRSLITTENTAELNLTEIPPGVYLVRISDAKGAPVYRKLVRE